MKTKTSPYPTRRGILLSLASTPLQAGTRRADVVVYGATSAGIAAAIQVSRMGHTALLLNPGTQTGGLTTGGLSWTDIGNKQVIGGIGANSTSASKSTTIHPPGYTRLRSNTVRSAIWRSSESGTPCGRSSRKWPPGFIARCWPKPASRSCPTPG